MNIGPVIKKLRKEKGMTGKKLAQCLNISPSTLSKYESNDRKIDANLIPKIALTLGVPVEKIFAEIIGETPIITGKEVKTG
ncbi:helix-turn-helix domain-containing protein [Paenibacillus chitinolyticus]|uniref:helix-turn-helix domain-containing protein n=1 Tax=Paenibacillus chitinolyticus TaxID=79263 RepID=UPI00364FE29D